MPFWQPSFAPLQTSSQNESSASKLASASTLAVQPLKSFKVEQFAEVGHLTATQQAYLRTAREMGVISGMGDNRFSPDSPALREQYFQIVANIYGLGLVETPAARSNKTAESFTDGASVPAWAIAATNELIQRGVIRGDGTSLQIGAAFNNATTAAVLAKLGGVIPNLPDEASPAKDTLLAVEPKKQANDAAEEVTVS